MFTARDHGPRGAPGAGVERKTQHRPGGLVGVRREVEKKWWDYGVGGGGAGMK